MRAGVAASQLATYICCADGRNPAGKVKTTLPPAPAFTKPRSCTRLPSLRYAALANASP